MCTQMARPVKKCRFLLASVYCKTLTSKYPRFGKVNETAKKEKKLPVAKLKKYFWQTQFRLKEDITIFPACLAPISG